MVSMVFVMITLASESAKRIVEVLEEKSSLVNPQNPVYEVKDGSVDFENVSFKYSKRQREMPWRTLTFILIPVRLLVLSVEPVLPSLL